jgi:cytochrome c oxidase subunit 2
MNSFNHKNSRRVLITSANPLFGKGLQKIYGKRWGANAVEIRLATSMNETLTLLESWQPQMVILDYDDQTIHREEFLSHFITGNRPMQVVLVSLQASGEVVVYDRRSLTPAQAEDWLNLPWQPDLPTQSPHRSGSMKGNAKHLVAAGLLVAVSTAVFYFLLTNIGLLPIEASTQAITIDRLFNAHFFMISLLFSLIVVFILYSLVVFRSKRGEKQEGAYFEGNNRLEVIWTVIPLGVVVAFAFFGARNLAETRQADPQALKVKVTAFQWGWNFEYPEFGIKSKDLYLPANRQVLLSLTSLDVIHSFWVPEFRVKQDALPGSNLVKELRITPNKEGTYQLLCAELCGGAHAYMTAKVNVVGKTAFDAWVAQQVGAVLTDPVARGKKWAETSGCLSCHSLDGKKLIGPSWKGLAGEKTELADGSSVVVDDAYLVKSILEPNAQIAKGFPANVMPGTYKTLLTDEQVNDIVAFIKSVK